MDVKISDGDIAMLSSGSYRYIAGLEEAVQRVRLAALTVKGDFIYDRELGTDYSGLSADDDLLVEKLDMLIKEACSEMKNTAVEALSCDRSTLVAVIRVAYGDSETTTEVDLSGILQ